MAAYRRVYDSRHLQADCQELGSAPEPYAPTPLPYPTGRRGGADLRFCSPQPDTTLHCLRDHGYGAIAHRVACLQCLLPSFRRYKQLPYLQTLWKSGEICRQTTEMQGAILNVFFYVGSTCVMYLNC